MEGNLFISNLPNISKNRENLDFKITYSGSKFEHKKNRSKLEIDGIGYFWDIRKPNPNTHSIFGLKGSSHRAHVIFENNVRTVKVVKTRDVTRKEILQGKTKEHVVEFYGDFDLESSRLDLLNSIKVYNNQDKIPPRIDHRFVKTIDTNFVLPYLNKRVTESDIPAFEECISTVSLSNLRTNDAILIGYNDSLMAIAHHAGLITIDSQIAMGRINTMLYPLLSYLQKCYIPKTYSLNGIFDEPWECASALNTSGFTISEREKELTLDIIAKQR